MPVESHAHSQAQTVIVSTPVITGRKWLYTWQSEVSECSHTSSATLGYESAIFTVSMAIDAGVATLNDWILRGLGRDITITDESGIGVWEGFVNQVSIQLGTLMIAVGPLVDIANRVSVVYSFIDDTTDPPVVGDQTITTLADQDESVFQYGIWEKQYTGDESTTTQAELLRDVILNDAAWPITTKTIQSASAVPVVTLECRGYADWLTAYLYTQTAASGTVTTETRIQEVLAADTNGIFSTDYSKIATNGTLASNFEDTDKNALTVIKDAVALGRNVSTGVYRRWLFGIGAGRRAHYYQVPETIMYENTLRDGDEIKLWTGSTVKPWAVKPGQWLFFSDFLTGTEPPVSLDELQRDPRALFIESCTYSAPYGLTVNGARIGSIKQAMAAYGLGGF